MSLILQIQKLEPGSEIMLFELDGSEFGADVLRFHGHAIPHTPQELAAAGANADQLPAKSIWWQGQEYTAWPVQISGIEANGDGTAVRPKFSAGNVSGRLTALCLAFDDLANFQLTIRETLAEFLDAENFPTGNPDADSTQESISIWYFDQKTGEDNQVVEWELASPGDVGNEAIGRQMTTLCHWCMTGGYRGPDCGYTGPYFDIDDNPTDDPAKDQCAGLYRSCNKRWGQGNQLPFGGFPAVSPDRPELTMRKQILSAIQAHAAEEYPREACGLIVGAGKAQQYFRCRNTASQPQEEFRMHPEDYAAAEDRGEVVAIVHSHPDATSRPSPHDLAMCEASGLPWHIVSWPEGDLRTIAPAGNIPLLGRPFVHGAWDCWQVCADWYQREWGLEFERFERQDGWWEQADGPSLYEQHFEAAGFYQVGTPRRGDMIVMAVGKTAHPNHAGIYLGADGSLPGEDSKVFGSGPFLLHHLLGKPSEVIVYGGNWHERARLVLRHRQARE